MATYREQLDVLADLRLREGQEHRGTCPFCGGRNTFTAKRQDGALIWNCYKASCGAHGSKDGPRPIQSVERLLAGLLLPPRAMIDGPLLTSIQNQPEIIKWLATYNSLEAFEKKLISVKYAPSEDRVMFKVSNPSWDKIKEEDGWIGRSMDPAVKPKWRRYGDCNHALSVGTGPCAVAVEDCLSACAVSGSSLYTGVALLGTNLSTVLKQELRQYKDIIICLDPDASDKALQMMSTLSGLHNVTMVVPPNDLKYYNTLQIEKILNGHTTNKTTAIN